MMKRWVLVLLVSLVMFSLVMGDIIPDDVEPIVDIKFIGSSRITDIINSNDSAKQALIMTSESERVLKMVSFPLLLPGTEITVNKYQCDFRNNMCGFCINATRGGQEVATRSPVWISPPPYMIIVSESYDARKNVLTFTAREDPLEAATRVLQRYVDSKPLGTRTAGSLCR